MENEHLWIRAPETTLVKFNTKNLIPEYIRNHLSSWGWGEATAFESAENGKKYTYDQVLKDSRAFAAGLIKLQDEFNLRQSDVVAVMLPNVPEYASIAFGIWEAGMVITPVNPNCVESEIRRQLQITCSKILITSSSHLKVARSLQEKIDNVRTIILVDDDDDSVAAGYEGHRYSNILKTDTNGVNFFTGSKIDKTNDVALLLFSSGTSGLPKAVKLTHFALLTNTLMSLDVIGGRFKMFQSGNIQTKTIAILPFFHVFGFCILMTASMIQGAHVLTVNAFNSETFIRKLKEFQPQVLFAVPTLLSFIANSNQVTKTDMNVVNTIFSGAANAGMELMKKLLQKATHAELIQGYGLTEAGNSVTACRTQLMGSVGQPLPGVVVKIIDTETGNTLGRREQGEICIKTPSAMKGYLDNEEATKESIDVDGWLHTGDIGYCDENGCLFIVGRLKELIKVKGFQVAPLELENLIRGHEKVAEVAVIGIPHEKCGEVPRAFVALKENNTMTEIEMIDFVDKQVTSYKRLQGGVQFMKTIPKGPTGKILRRQLKDGFTNLN